jgi:hypothetical protein
MTRVIIESPYAAGNNRTVKQNIAYARRCVKDSLDRGEAPIASHLLYTQPGILDDSKPEERKKGIMAGYKWYGIHTTVAFYVDYGISNGMIEALEMIEKLNRDNDGYRTRINIEYRRINGGKHADKKPATP